jgi:PTH1 family peptidyl-tRNA hydrolase
MKYLIVGLGNVGAKYEHTRHNVGFDVLEHLAREQEATWNADSFGSLARVKHRGRTFVLLKPDTYVNLSGNAVRYWMQKEKIPKERLLVIVDDLNLEFGKLRLRAKGSDGGHNGLKSIDSTTGGNNYARLRFGIGADFPKGRQVEFVLGEWSADERAALPDLFERSARAILAFGAIGIQHAMNKFNG